MPTIDNWRALREALDSGLTARELASAGHAGSLGRLLAERDRLESDATNCQQLVWALARELKCLPSIFSDANGHVLKAAIALNEERDRLAAEVEALRADAGRYRWLRHGDNDAEVMVFDNQTRASPENVWLPRLDELDAAIDAAMKGTP